VQLRRKHCRRDRSAGNAGNREKRYAIKEKARGNPETTTQSIHPGAFLCFGCLAKGDLLAKYVNRGTSGKADCRLFAFPPRKILPAAAAAAVVIAQSIQLNFYAKQTHGNYISLEDLLVNRG